MNSRVWSIDRRPTPAWPLAALLVLASGCHSLRLESWPFDRGERGKDAPTAAAAGPAPPGKHQFRVSQYVFRSDFEVQRDLPIFRELANLREQVYRELQLPGADNLVQVFLFEDRDHYDRFMQVKYPDLPKRRAFFVAQPRPGGQEDLLVYTYWGDRINEDLRHELTHALLHSVLKDVPLWLDEGLAENFEVAPEWKGVNHKHLDQLRHGDGVFKPNLDRLEGLTQVQDMSPAEYREAWAWVHLMLHDRPEAKVVLTNYLQQLRKTSNPGTLAPRLSAIYPSPNEALSQHLARLETPGAPEHAQAVVPASAPVK